MADSPAPAVKPRLFSVMDIGSLARGCAFAMLAKLLVLARASPPACIHSQLACRRCNVEARLRVRHHTVAYKQAAIRVEAMCWSIGGAHCTLYKRHCGIVVVFSLGMLIAAAATSGTLMSYSLNTSLSAAGTVVRVTKAPFDCTSMTTRASSVHDDMLPSSATASRMPTSTVPVTMPAAWTQGDAGVVAVHKCGTGIHIVGLGHERKACKRM